MHAMRLKSCVKGDPSRETISLTIPPHVKHLVVGSYLDRFGSDLDCDEQRYKWEAWLKTQYFKGGLETLVLNTPVQHDAAIVLKPKSVHVHFMDVSHPNDPWHLSNHTGGGDVHIRYIPALVPDTDYDTVLDALKTLVSYIKGGQSRLTKPYA